MDSDLCAITSTESLLEAIHQFNEKGYLKVETSFGGQARSTSQMPGEANIGSRSVDVVVSAINSDDITGQSPSFAERVARARERPTPNVNNRDQQNFNHLEDIHEDDVKAHLMDEFKDHFNLDNPRDFFPGDDNGDELYVMAKYDINGRPVKSPFFSMDDVYLDLTTGPHPNGDFFVRMAIPGAMLARILDQASGFPTPPLPVESPLDPVIVAFDPAIGFKFMQEDLTQVDCGTLGGAVQAEEYRHFYKVSAVFSATATKDPVSLALQLEDIMVFSEQDEVLESLMGDDCGCGDDPAGDGPWSMNNFTSPDEYNSEYESEYESEYYY